MREQLCGHARLQHQLQSGDGALDDVGATANQEAIPVSHLFLNRKNEFNFLSFQSVRLKIPQSLLEFRALLHQFYDHICHILIYEVIF